MRDERKPDTTVRRPRDAPGRRGGASIPTNARWFAVTIAGPHLPAMPIPAVHLLTTCRQRLRSPAPPRVGRVRRGLAARALLLSACALAGCTPQARRERAVTAVRRSLRTVVYAADQHKVATGSYANFMAPPGFAGVTIIVSDLSALGFQARATHRRYDRSDLECHVGIGPATPLGLAEGEPGGPQCL